jgi:hypothetical protein
MACLAAPIFPHTGGEDYFCSQHDAERAGHWGVDCIMVPVSMKLLNKILLVTIVFASTAVPANAQVERAAVKTVRLGCGLCAVFSEIYLRQIGTIDKIQISKSQEAVMVTYKPGSSFQPAALRNALKKTEVGVAEIQIGARGRLQEQGGKQFFVAGKDRFVLVSAPKSPKVPAGTNDSLE